MFNFFFFDNKRNQVRLKDEYNMWKTKKTMKIKNKKYLNIFYIFNFIFYYLLILNAALKEIKNTK